LLALLKAIPQIGTIQQMENNLDALKLVPHQNKTLLLLDAGLINQELWSYMKQVKGRYSHTQCKCIVLAENKFQQRMAQAAGVDRVLLAGFPASEFFAAFENLFDGAEAHLEVTERKNGKTPLH
jgi:DNA-binding NarL/FixJ family response regulator